jgi:hypothetical protein
VGMVAVEPPGLPVLELVFPATAPPWVVVVPPEVLVPPLGVVPPVAPAPPEVEPPGPVVLPPEAVPPDPPCEPPGALLLPPDDEAPPDDEIAPPCEVSLLPPTAPALAWLPLPALPPVAPVEDEPPSQAPTRPIRQRTISFLVRFIISIIIL